MCIALDESLSNMEVNIRQIKRADDCLFPIRSLLLEVLCESRDGLNCRRGCVLTSVHSRLSEYKCEVILPLTSPGFK